MQETTTLAESNNFIVLDHYDRKERKDVDYQSEDDLENEFIQDLQSQGYEYRTDIKDHDAMLVNVRRQLEELNAIRFTDSEWDRFRKEWLDSPSDGLVEQSRKVHENYQYDFVFDDGRVQNIYLFDKKRLHRNKVQVINQFEQYGKHLNRYDVTILVNGLPMIQVELKRRNVAIREAFNQVHRYSKESFNSPNSLYKYLQLFVISDGTYTRYFANTTKRDKHGYDFTIQWARADNQPIDDLKDFTETFFEKRTMLSVLLKYSVFDANDTLLVMRPYQIAATERLLWRLQCAYNAKEWGTVNGGGYVWHTTGSGKTLTSFKAARLATEMPFVDKVFFVVDRKDLDSQTMQEYERFSKGSVNGSSNTAKLKENLDKEDNRIIVTTIQKLNRLMKTEQSLPVYHQQVVFIFDECHRSQFGEAQGNLKKRFRKFYQFGFTGTPIFKENAYGHATTADVFGNELHSYIITDALRDQKVLKFIVDYQEVAPQFKDIENENDIKRLHTKDILRAFLHPERIHKVTSYILQRFNQKTLRNSFNGYGGFNAMMAVSSVDAAKLYYEAFRHQQKNSKNPLKVATIFSFAANETQSAITSESRGDIVDEPIDVSAMDSSAKEFLASAISDYNAMFSTNFTLDGDGFQRYYDHVSTSVKNTQIDLLIVVGMFLTGFDAPKLNTLFVDKNLRHHGLIQAYSRTNRIYDVNKTAGNIVTFRNLESATSEALVLFAKNNAGHFNQLKDVIFEKSYREYMYGFTDTDTGSAERGFVDVAAELKERFPVGDALVTESDKKEFVKLFGSYLNLSNKLRSYDEFDTLKEFVSIQENADTTPEDILQFKEKHHLNDADITELQAIHLPSTRDLQDYKSTYYNVRDWLNDQKNSQIACDEDWSDVVFEIELVKSQEINLDYILELLFNHYKKMNNKADLIDEARRLISASFEHRSKEGLVVEFINQCDITKTPNKDGLIDAFYSFARGEQKREFDVVISEEKLQEDAAQRYVEKSLRAGYASENGADLVECLPKISPLNPDYQSLKRRVFRKISRFIDKFHGIGGFTVS